MQLTPAVQLTPRQPAAVPRPVTGVVSAGSHKPIGDLPFYLVGETVSYCISFCPACS